MNIYRSTVLIQHFVYIYIYIFPLYLYDSMISINKTINLLYGVLEVWNLCNLPQFHHKPARQMLAHAFVSFHPPTSLFCFLNCYFCLCSLQSSCCRWYHSKGSSSLPPPGNSKSTAESGQVCSLTHELICQLAPDHTNNMVLSIFAPAWAPMLQRLTGCIPIFLLKNILILCERLYFQALHR